MAGDWIKMRVDLRSDPAVFKLADLTQLDRFSVVGRLAEFWGWIDKHAVDGRVDGATTVIIDDVVAHQGFAAALVDVNWLVVDASGVYIPKHEQHNGDSAKERSLKSERQARWRAKQAASRGSKPVDGHVDGAVDGHVGATALPEKRREEKKNTSCSTPPDKPAGKRKASKRVPGDFSVTEDLEQWAASNAPLVDWRRETEKFRDWEFQHARTDWPATWRTWMRKAQETAEGKSGAQAPRQESFV